MRRTVSTHGRPPRGQNPRVSPLAGSMAACWPSLDLSGFRPRECHAVQDASPSASHQDYVSMTTLTNRATALNSAVHIISLVGQLNEQPVEHGDRLCELPPLPRALGRTLGRLRRLSPLSAHPYRWRHREREASLEASPRCAQRLVRRILGKVSPIIDFSASSPAARRSSRPCRARRSCVAVRP